MKVKIVHVVLLILITGCARTKDTNTTVPSIGPDEIAADSIAVPVNSKYTIDHYLTTAVPDTADVIIIDYDCALIVNPTIEQITKMRAEYGEEDFYIVADDNMWYQGNAVGLLDSLKIHRVDAVKPFVSFYGREGRWTLNLRKAGALPWNVILFNTGKKPEIVSTVDLTAVKIISYFN